MTVVDIEPEASRGNQFLEVLEILEELNVQAARLQEAVGKSVDWLTSETTRGAGDRRDTH